MKYYWTSSQLFKRLMKRKTQHKHQTTRNLASNNLNLLLEITCHYLCAPRKNDFKTEWENLHPWCKNTIEFKSLLIECQPKHLKQRVLWNERENRTKNLNNPLHQRNNAQKNQATLPKMERKHALIPLLFQREIIPLDQKIHPVMTKTMRGNHACYLCN